MNTEALNAELLGMLKAVTEEGEMWMDESRGRRDAPVFLEARKLIARVEGG